ncbi:MAG: VCBS repeat-containing protein [Planctomycetes bacterium]|nr:VCBS repeat-containing protein [Planctomycetota bacterium]
MEGERPDDPPLQPQGEIGPFDLEPAIQPRSAPPGAPGAPGSRGARREPRGLREERGTGIRRVVSAHGRPARREALLALLALAAGCSGPSEVYRKDPGEIPFYREVSFEASAPVESVLFQDLDGDGSADLLLVGEEGAELVLDPAAPVPRARVSFAFPEGWTHHELGTVPGGARELYLFSPEGVTRYGLGGGEPKPEKIVSAPYPDEPPRAEEETLDLFQGGFATGSWGIDLDGDGWTDFVAPGKGDAERVFALYRKGPAGWSPAGSIAVPAGGREANWTPAFYPCNYDGDSNQDLVVAVPEGVYFFAGAPGGRISPRAAGRLAFGGAGKGFLGLFGGGEESEPRTGTASAGDLDGDGLPEFLLSERDSDLWRIHRGRKGDLPDPEPAAEIRPGGDMRFGPLVADTDGDGRIDVSFLVLSTPGAVGAALGAVLFGEIGVDLEVVTYRAGEGELPGEGTRDSRSFSMDIDLEAIEEGGELAELYSRVRSVDDLDGDGRLDAVLSTPEGRLAIYYNVENRPPDAPAVEANRLEELVRRTLDLTLDAAATLAERPPDRVVRIPGAFEPERVALATADANGDGQKDLLLHERHASRTLLLLVSRLERSR